MKIVFVGNTNCYPFRLVRELRGSGVDAHLVVYETQILHRPEGEDPSLRNAYPPWVHDFSHLTEADFASPAKSLAPLLALLGQSDALVLNGLGPSLRALVDKPSIAWLTGSDLDYHANHASIAAREAIWSAGYRRSIMARRERLLWRRLIARQRSGIRRSLATSYFHRGINPEGDALLDRIGVADSARFFIYMADAAGCGFHPPAANPVPRILCGARLTWVPPIPSGGSVLDFKGSDIMLRGVARYLVCNPDARFELRLVRKGLHIAQTQALVRECALDRHVVWLDEMPLHEFMDELRRADVVFDQIGTSMVGMAGLDAMAMGRPVIANGRPEIWRRATGEVLPICQAASVEEVCRQLARLLSSEQERIRSGREAYEFASARLTPAASAAQILAHFRRPGRTTLVSTMMNWIAR